jgi:3',5'-cyclic-AMP phosphodiesterase
VIIAHLTDIHFRPFGGLSHGVVSEKIVFARAIERLNSLLPRPDLVVITGDLTHAGKPAEYEALVQQLKRLDLPVLVIPGNHDSREETMAAFPHQAFRREAGFAQFAVDLGPLTLIGLDTIKKGSSGGALCADRLAFLEVELGKAKDRPVFIAMHHPPVKVGMRSMDPIWLQDGRDEFAALIATHGKVEAILCGHYHRPAVGRLHGAPVFIGPSLVAQAQFGLDPHDEARFLEEPPAFHVHFWRESDGLITHTVFVDQPRDVYRWS